MHSVEGDMTTQTVSVRQPTRRRGAGGDKDIVLRRYDRSYDGGGEQPAVVVMTESRDGEITTSKTTTSRARLWILGRDSRRLGEAGEP